MNNRTYYKGLIKKLDKNSVFVFGSNPEGRHGLGAAKIAKEKFGAIYGKGRGLQGNSYGLVTKNLKKGFLEKETGITYSKVGERSVSESMIIDNIKELYDFAKNHSDKKFYIAYMINSKNLNGYSDKEMASFFSKGGEKIPNNIIFEENFAKLIFKESIYVYTDGACSNNGKANAKAGIGIYFSEGDSRNLSARIKGRQTNNRAEIIAIIMVYKILKKEIEKGEKKVIVYSDSQYAIRAATTYGKKMAAKDFKNIPNSDLVKMVYTLYKDKPNVEFMHVKAHTNNSDAHSIGNQEADRLAVYSIQES